MSSDAPSERAGTAVPAKPGPERPRLRRRMGMALAGALVALVAVGAGAGIAHQFWSGGPPKGGAANNANPTSLATVIRQSLSSQTNVSATLGYAASYSVINLAQGTITSLPGVGQAVSQGEVIYQVSGAPVVLLYGSTPAYRGLSRGVLAGSDVKELNAGLVAMGYATSSEIPDASAEFTWWTMDALEKLQAHLGVAQTGTLTLGQAVFLSTAVRVTAVTATLGAPVGPGQPVLIASSTSRQVSMAISAAQQSEVKVGDKVTISLPNKKTTAGVVSSVGTVATTPPTSGGSGSASPTITVLVTPSDPAATGSLEGAPVQVAITTASVDNALVVPVNALLAQPGGGYAVELVSGQGPHRMLPVGLGLFDDADGLVQVTGAGLAAGQHVVVPAA